MTEAEIRAMDQYGISQQTNTTFHFAGYRYQRLEDAIKYATNHQHLINAANTDTKSKS
ncbi:MAG: hypothetical protein HN856_02965 [Gammaproteobacteria bacterium]|jgi:hypothetical protein|nr:hypothetical protein [Gammaproteobacteria bacterium]